MKPDEWIPIGVTIMLILGAIALGWTAILNWIESENTRRRLELRTQHLDVANGEE
jgi:hypothetical protein